MAGRHPDTRLSLWARWPRPAAKDLWHHLFDRLEWTGLYARGRYGRTLEEITTPFELMAVHTGMHYLPHFALPDVCELADAAVAASPRAYVDQLRHAAPRIVASGKDDDRTRTVYPKG